MYISNVLNIYYIFGNITGAFTTLTHTWMCSFVYHSLKASTVIDAFVECTVEIFPNIRQTLQMMRVFLV